MLARRNISAAHLKQAPGRNEISQIVNSQNSGDSRAVVDESDERSCEKHSRLHANDNCGICARVLTLRNHFLHKGINIGPIHRGPDAGNQRDGVKVPKLEVAAPRDVSSSKHSNAADKIQNHAKVAAVETVD